MSLSVVPFRQPPLDAQPAAGQISSTGRTCAILALAVGVGGYLQFGISLFPGAHVLSGAGTAVCALLAVWLVYSLAGLAWLSFLERKNGLLPPVQLSEAQLPPEADPRDRILHLLLTSQASLSHQVALVDPQMNAHDVHVVDNVTGSSLALVLKVSEDQAETRDQEMPGASSDDGASRSAGHEVTRWSQGPAGPMHMSMPVSAVACLGHFRPRIGPEGGMEGGAFTIETAEEDASSSTWSRASDVAANPSLDAVLFV